MDPRGIAKARSRLALAEKAGADLIYLWGMNQSFADAWFTFLIACKGVYTALEQGAKASATSRQWYGKVARKRRETPLFQYIFQARDDDLHGLGDVTEYTPGALYFEDAGKEKVDATSFKGRTLLNKLHVFSGEASGVVTVTGQVPMTRLLTVTGRGGVRFDPPTDHNGFTFGITAPLQMAHFVLDHLTGVLAEAERLT